MTTSQKESSQALAGITVVDVTHTLAGPLCAQMFADAGATVIKVEPPGGEFSRIRGLKRVTNGVEVSSYSAAVNRGKKSVSIDFKNEKGLALIRELIGKADVLVENFAPATMSRIGLDLDGLRAEFPRLVTVSISLFGAEKTAGALASRGGFALIAESEAAITSGMRDANDKPMMSPMPLGDMVSAVAGYGGAVTALLERERTGKGRHVEISMVRALMTMNAIAITTEQISRSLEDVPQLGTGGYGIYETKDGFVSIAVTTDRLFHRLAHAMGRSDMVTDERYANFRERDLRIDEVNDAVAAWTTQHTTAEIEEACTLGSVPVGQVKTAADLVDSEDIARMGFLQEIDDGGGSPIRAPQNPFGYAQAQYALPRFNQHRDEVLSGILGRSPEEIAALVADGAVDAQVD